jgi:hypothetical protein
MKAICVRIISIAVLAGAVAYAWHAQAGNEVVLFPQNFEKGVHYATVTRGDIREEIFTSREAIDAAKHDEPFPSGTVITLVDYRSDALYRYVVIEKRTGWGTEYPASLRTGEWEFQSFNPDKTIKADGQPERCMSCHKSRAPQDFVWTIDQMKSAP